MRSADSDTTLRISKETHALIEAIAALQSWTHKTVVARAVAELMKNKGMQLEPPPAPRRAARRRTAA